MTVVKVMADYHAFPLWIEDGPRVGNINPSELRISAELSDALLAWAEEYTGTLNRDEPQASGFADVATELAFVGKGRALADRLAAELGNGARVTFFHVGRAGRFDTRK